MISQNMDNVWFYQFYAGVKPMPRMDLMVALSYATADKKPKSDVGAVGVRKKRVRAIIYCFFNILGMSLA
ncbi:MAG TPA: hypothetical protein PK175_09880 [Syntrophales bacterium]|jgi:hypothetical protein|nr:hypothetical protein [Syntrophales bacterium]HON22460.1 hypothetical protein [Syntrophales bacterium]HOU78571.1 hypothetical protein [Syntrophales bacterium]HPC33677.1 hypothetical protein [Syntrophales bacterium]HQG35169.1 hypothetical protein [Syntrophales bacterium]